MRRPKAQQVQSEGPAPTTQARGRETMPATGSHYVYLLIAANHPDQHYSGYTTDLEARLKKHNEGGVPNTAKSKPWRLETAISFRSESKARAFEHYLKSGSGREFSRRHF